MQTCTNYLLCVFLYVKSLKNYHTDINWSVSDYVWLQHLFLIRFCFVGQWNKRILFLSLVTIRCDRKRNEIKSIPLALFHLVPFETSCFSLWLLWMLLPGHFYWVKHSIFNKKKINSKCTDGIRLYWMLTDFSFSDFWIATSLLLKKVFQQIYNGFHQFTETELSC